MGNEVTHRGVSLPAGKLIDMHVFNSLDSKGACMFVSVFIFVLHATKSSFFFVCLFGHFLKV